jgi:cysteine desulfurase / selenocysteine lyase
MSKITYLNNAATSWPKAPGLEKYISKIILDPPVKESRTSSEYELDIINSVRKSVADKINIQNENNIIFTQSATYSLNTVLHGLCEKGLKVLTSLAEHNSVLRPL